MYSSMLISVSSTAISWLAAAEKLVGRRPAQPSNPPTRVVSQALHSLIQTALHCTPPHNVGHASQDFAHTYKCCARMGLQKKLIGNICAVSHRSARERNGWQWAGALACSGDDAPCVMGGGEGRALGECRAVVIVCDAGGAPLHVEHLHREWPQDCHTVLPLRCHQVPHSCHRALNRASNRSCNALRNLATGTTRQEVPGELRAGVSQSGQQSVGATRVVTALRQATSHTGSG